VTLDSPLPASVLKGRLQIRVGRVHFERNPVRSERSREPRIHVGHDLLHAIGLPRQRIEADPSVSLASSQEAIAMVSVALTLTV
jgi:hypothetical protein